MFTVSALQTGYSELNNASVLLRLEYGGAAYLYRDAEAAQSVTCLIFGQSALRCDAESPPRLGNLDHR